MFGSFRRAFNPSQDEKKTDEQYCREALEDGINAKECWTCRFFEAEDSRYPEYMGRYGKCALGYDLNNNECKDWLQKEALHG